MNYGRGGMWPHKPTNVHKSTDVCEFTRAQQRLDQAEVWVPAIWVLFDEQTLGKKSEKYEVLVKLLTRQKQQSSVTAAYEGQSGGQLTVRPRARPS